MTYLANNYLDCNFRYALELLERVIDGRVKNRSWFQCMAPFVKNVLTCYNLMQTPPLRGLGSWDRQAGAFSGPGPGAFLGFHAIYRNGVSDFLPALLPFGHRRVVQMRVDICTENLVRDAGANFCLSVYMTDVDMRDRFTSLQVEQEILVFSILVVASALKKQTVDMRLVKANEHLLQAFSPCALLLVGNQRACDNDSRRMCNTRDNLKRLFLQFHAQVPPMKLLGSFGLNSIKHFEEVKRIVEEYRCSKQIHWRIGFHAHALIAPGDYREIRVGFSIGNTTKK